jgi:hypothetical protein
MNYDSINSTNRSIAFVQELCAIIFLSIKDRFLFKKEYGNEQQNDFCLTLVENYENENTTLFGNNWL